MRAVLRTRSSRARDGERVPLHTRVRLTSLAGRPLASLACTRDVGLGGLRVTAPAALSPGTPLIVSLRLPGGSRFECAGHVVWSKQTLHPALFGSPMGSDDDATFGIAFDTAAPERLLPIARLLVAKDHERHRARRIRRLHGLPNHA